MIDYLEFITKVRAMLKIIKKEYEIIIIKNYNEERIIEKSYPIKANKTVDKYEKKHIEEEIKKFFNPSLNEMSILIDNGFIEWDKAIEKVKLEEICDDKSKITNLIYESWDNLYIYKRIKYDLIMNFIMQVYLYLEKELSILLCKQYYNNSNTLFSCISIIEKDGKQVSNSTKEELDMYRKIINVHKHGRGRSFNEIKEKYENILNIKELHSNDSSFLFNLKIVSFENVCNTIEKILDELYVQI